MKKPKHRYLPVKQRSYVEKLLWIDLKQKKITRAEYNKKLRYLNNV